jgi:hypothetical protein
MRRKTPAIILFFANNYANTKKIAMARLYSDSSLMAHSPSQHIHNADALIFLALQ